VTRIYVAAPLPLIADARAMARRLASAGHRVTSSWHDGNPTVELEAAMTAPGRMALADACEGEVLASSALVLLYGPETTRHGSVFEAGIAYGVGLRVIAVATSERAVLPTALLWAGGVRHCGLDDVIEALS